MFQYLKLTRLLKLFRVAKLFKIFSALENEGRLDPSSVQLIQLSMVVTFIAHLLACLWFVIGHYAMATQLAAEVAIRQKLEGTQNALQREVPQAPSHTSLQISNSFLTFSFTGIRQKHRKRVLYNERWQRPLNKLALSVQDLVSLRNVFN